MNVCFCPACLVLDILISNIGTYINCILCICMEFPYPSQTSSFAKGSFCGFVILFGTISTVHLMNHRGLEVGGDEISDGERR